MYTIDFLPPGNKLDFLFHAMAAHRARAAMHVVPAPGQTRLPGRRPKLLAGRESWLLRAGPQLLDAHGHDVNCQGPVLLGAPVVLKSPHPIFGTHSVVREVVVDLWGEAAVQLWDYWLRRRDNLGLTNAGRKGALKKLGWTKKKYQCAAERLVDARVVGKPTLQKRRTGDGRVTSLAARLVLGDDDGAYRIKLPRAAVERLEVLKDRRIHNLTGWNGGSEKRRRKDVQGGPGKEGKIEPSTGTPLNLAEGAKSTLLDAKRDVQGGPLVDLDQTGRDASSSSKKKHGAADASHFVFEGKEEEAPTPLALPAALPSAASTPSAALPTSLPVPDTARAAAPPTETPLVAVIPPEDRCRVCQTRRLMMEDGTCSKCWFERRSTVTTELRAKIQEESKRQRVKDEAAALEARKKGSKSWDYPPNRRR